MRPSSGTHPWFVRALLVLAVALLVVILTNEELLQVGLLRRLELSTLDYRFGIRGAHGGIDDSSDVVIVNHHLLCADAAVRQGSYGDVLPECAYAVIDEAHQLEDVATQYFGFSVSNHRLATAAGSSMTTASLDERWRGSTNGAACSSRR